MLKICFPEKRPKIVGKKKSAKKSQQKRWQERWEKSLFLNLSCCCLETCLKPGLFFFIVGKPLHLKPRYIAYLVYKGGRPTHGQKVRDVTPEDVLQNPPLCQWLVTRSIPNEAFISIVNGKALNQILPERPRKRPTEG